MPPLTENLAPLAIASTHGHLTPRDALGFDKFPRRVGDSLRTVTALWGGALRHYRHCAIAGAVALPALRHLEGRYSIAGTAAPPAPRHSCHRNRADTG